MLLFVWPDTLKNRKLRTLIIPLSIPEEWPIPSAGHKAESAQYPFKYFPILLAGFKNLAFLDV